MGEWVIVVTFKKGLRNCDVNYWSVNLIPIAPKLLSSVTIRRLYNTREEDVL